MRSSAALGEMSSERSLPSKGTTWTTLWAYRRVIAGGEYTWVFFCKTESGKGDDHTGKTKDMAQIWMRSPDVLLTLLVMKIPSDV